MASKRDIQRLSKQITDLSKALANLDKPEEWKELILILRRPGWTTPAELVFVSAILTAMLQQTKVLTDLRGQLLKGSEIVGTEQIRR